MSFTDDLDAVRDRAGIRRRARFCIKRINVAHSSPWPWVIRDETRPGVYGHAVDHAAAVRLVWLIAGGTWGTAARVERDGVVVAYITGAS